jgi:hypothetical protein
MVTCLVLFSGEAALGQTITLTSPPYVPPPPGGVGVGSFNASGTWQMGAGQTISKITIYLEEKLPNQANWVPVGGALPATRDNLNKTYSGTFNKTAVVGAQYRMKAYLFKSQNGNAVQVATSPNGNAWLDVTPPANDPSPTEE